MQYCLAIDVACGISMFCILSDAGELVMRPTEYPHTISGFGGVLSELVKLNSADIHIIMESTLVYHKENHYGFSSSSVQLHFTIYHFIRFSLFHM